MEQLELWRFGREGEKLKACLGRRCLSSLGGFWAYESLSFPPILLQHRNLLSFDEYLRDLKSMNKGARELVTCLQTIDDNIHLEVLYETSFGLYYFCGRQNREFPIFFIGDLEYFGLCFYGNEILASKMKQNSWHACMQISSN